MKKIPRWLIISGAIFLLVICVFLSSLMGNDKKPDPTPDQEKIMEQVKQTIEAGVAQTIEANFTPTPKITATMDDFVAEFLAMPDKLDNCSQSMGALSFTYGQIADNPNLLRNQTFLNELNKELDQLDLHCTNFWLENVPADFVDFDTANEYLKQADEQFQIYVDTMRIGMNNIDTYMTLAANQYLDNGGVFLHLAIAELEKMIP